MRLLDRSVGIELERTEVADDLEDCFGIVLGPLLFGGQQRLGNRDATGSFGRENDGLSHQRSLIG